jgi:hypothetical protein
MKSKSSFDPEFGEKARRGCGPIHSIGQLMIAVALIGLTFGIVTMRPKRGVSASPIVRLSPAALTVVQGPGPIPPAPFAQPRDRFAIVARPDLDAGMVFQARPDLDAGMVINPDTRGRSSWVAPQIGEGSLLPGQAPVPNLDQGGPNEWFRNPPVIPQPNPR